MQVNGLKSPLLTAFAWRAFRTDIISAASPPTMPMQPRARAASAMVSTLLSVPLLPELSLWVAVSPDTAAYVANKIHRLVAAT